MDDPLPRKQIIVATRNHGKIREYTALLNKYRYDVLTLSDLQISEEIIEDGDTFEENAHIKADFIREKTGLPVIADDSGLEVEFLNGAPGIYSARYGGESLTDAQRCELILEELLGVEKPLRTAKFTCAIYFIGEQKDPTEEFCVTGELEGYIADKPEGKNGFGYDPIFVAETQDGEEMTIAEMTEEDKNKISHRAKALKSLIEELDNIAG